MRNPAAFAVFCLGVTHVGGFGTCLMRCRRAPRVRHRRNAMPRCTNPSWERGERHTSLWRRPSWRYEPMYLSSGKSDDYGADYSEYGYEPEYEIQDEESFSDEETLAKWRLEKLLTNDKWQFGLYGKQTTGCWSGRWQEYVAQELLVDDDVGGEPMIGLVPGYSFTANTRITRRTVEDATEKSIITHVHEQPPGADGRDSHHPAPLFETLFMDSFRGENGTQVVGNTYTMGAARRVAPGSAAGDLGDVWVELGLRKRDVRVRCIFQYGQGDEEARVERVFLVREGLERLPNANGLAEVGDSGVLVQCHVGQRDKVELYGAAGKGLYDPPRLSRSPLYMSLYAEGGLTIRFPLRVKTGDPGVFSVDWTAGEIRYQADRTFDVLDGSCRRLEVTEIGTADSEVYLPEEKF